MSGGVDPTQHIWWLSSRALGIVAMVLVSLSVGLGLAIAGRLGRQPGLPARMKNWHEALALALDKRLTAIGEDHPMPYSGDPGAPAPAG